VSPRLSQRGREGHLAVRRKVSGSHRQKDAESREAKAAAALSGSQQESCPRDASRNLPRNQQHQNGKVLLKNHHALPEAVINEPLAALAKLKAVVSPHERVQETAYQASRETY